ncbi:hypothetical protein GOODEAATRI_013315 [Goodea atripinnis]|uniref:Uncharacterized protein n=1 Tax=Goodea atripinnis TaxID=208336 RepID=A0ABV0PNA6_9TELE
MQILILALCLGACRARCHNETKLDEEAQRWLLKHYPWPATPTPSADTSTSCPLSLYQELPSLAVNDRSVSPWKYITLSTLKTSNSPFKVYFCFYTRVTEILFLLHRTVSKPDYYPSSYTEAKCLCSGCILVHQNGSVTENFDYNTKPLMHKSVFLKRVKCKEGKYRLVPERLEVSVGCICVRANTVQS